MVMVVVVVWWCGGRWHCCCCSLVAATGWCCYRSFLLALLSLLPYTQVNSSPLSINTSRSSSQDKRSTRRCGKKKQTREGEQYESGMEEKKHTESDPAGGLPQSSMHLSTRLAGRRTSSSGLLKPAGPSPPPRFPREHRPRAGGRAGGRSRRCHLPPVDLRQRRRHSIIVFFFFRWSHLDYAYSYPDNCFSFK